jgi:hypothetical protein
MRSRILPVAGVSIAALALVATFAPSASASHGVVPSAFGHATSKAAVSHKVGTDAPCYSQMATDSGNAAVSQNFTDAGGTLDAYDNQAADDFQLKAFNVQFCAWHKSKPCHKLKIKNSSQKNLKKYTGPTGANVEGNFVIQLNKPVTLPKGKYWISIQANMPFNSGSTGEFGWELIQPTVMDPSMWINPGDGFASGCTTWKDLGTCLALGASYDTAFAIN